MENNIKAATPIFLATIGLVIAVVVLARSDKLPEGQVASGLALAGNAIAAAAGAAQSSGAKSDLVQKGLISNEVEVKDS